MIRRLPILFAAFLGGCGGSGGLLATVPPPVEFATLPVGVVEVPKSGLLEGELDLEHVVLTKRRDGGYDETITSLTRSTAEAEIGEDGSITLRREGERPTLFSGTLIAETGESPRTYAELRAFDGNEERFPYTYRRDPFGLDIVARTLVKASGRKIEFDRYRFSFQD